MAAWLRFPALVLLLGTGILLGPVTGIAVPEAVFGQLLDPFVSLAVALVLFEGGLSLNLREARHVGPTLWRLIVTGLVVGFILTMLAGIYLGGLTPETSAVLGAILVVTGPTVILPMLRAARISLRPAALLKWEGIVNDPLGVLLVFFVFQAVIGGEAAAQGFVPLAIDFLGTTALAALIGMFAGVILDRALHRGWIAENLKGPVILASVLVVYSASEAVLPESGLLAVTVAGLVLGNRGHASIEDLRRFKEQISTLLVSILFIVLSASLELESLEELGGGPMLFIAAVLFVVRPVVVLLATLFSDLPWRERAIVGWIAPRGVVAAAMAGALQPRMDSVDSHLLVPIVFGVIFSSVMLHGLSISPLARRLGLAAVEGNGILIVGAARWVVSLAQALAKAGAYVVLADTRYRYVSEARVGGLEVHYGDVLEEDAVMELPMERVSWVLTATDDDAYNSLVCMHFVPDLGRERTLQVTPAMTESGKEVRHRMLGRSPWGDAASHEDISRYFWKGATFKVTSISEAFGWEELQEKNPDALFLFYLHQEKLVVFDEPTAPPERAKVIYLA